MVTRSARLLEAVAARFPAELAPADTIGVATPRDVAGRVGAVSRAFPDLPLRLHLHDARGTGIGSVRDGPESGVRSFDASLGGTGGRPFAPRAAGNVATEDLAYMLERVGVETGMDPDAAIRAAGWPEARLGHALPGRVMRAAGFPPPSAA